MAEVVSPIALTTLQRVKDLLFDPSLVITLTGTTSVSSTSISSTVIQVGKTVRIGQTITGPGIPAGAYITASAVGTLTISAAATVAATGVALTIIDQPVAFDVVLTRLINWATNFINQECGKTSFVQQSYVNDTYTIEKSGQDELLLRNTPVFPYSVALAGSVVTQGSATVTGFTVPAGMPIFPGMLVNGAGIPVGTVISSIISSTSILLSETATVGGTISINVYDVAHITEFSWRAGTPSNPSWTDFIPDQYEMLNPRIDPVSGIPFFPAGIVKVYGVMPRIYGNMIRATYVAGYPVNWANAEDHSTHWLPGDITNVCENLVIRRFKRRQLAGMASQALEGATHSWRNELDADDRAVIGQYKQINF